MILDRFTNFIVLTFSFFLAFGKLDPFATQGFFLNGILILVIIAIGLSTPVIKDIKIFGNQLFLLAAIGVILFVLGMLYEGISSNTYYFNSKYFSAIIVFWFLSYYFLLYPKKCFYSILLFALSSSLIAILYQLGYLNAFVNTTRGRLIIFEENPNSFSSRMAIAFIIITYFILEDPLKFKKIRFLLLVLLPSLFFIVVDTGSRGSFIGLLLGAGLMVVFANVKFSYKLALIIFSVVLSFYLFKQLSPTALIERFSQEEGIGVREKIWSNSLEVFYDYPFGVGEAGYYIEMEKRFSEKHAPHNLFIYLVVTGGFISLILFLVFLKKLFLKSTSMLKAGNSFLITIFVFLIFLISKTGGVFTYLIMWYFFAVINSVNVKYVNE